MNKSPSPESTADPTALNEFMSSLQRLFKIGIYYPSGHTILDKATDNFINQVIGVAGEKKSVILKTFSNTIILEGIQLDVEQPFVQDFNELLTTLGISGVEISKHITMPELHEFVRKMLAHKARVRNAKQFTQVQIDDLPMSISIEQQQFLSTSDSTHRSDAGGAGESLSSFMESLGKYGLSEDEVLQCRSLLESLPKQLSQSSMDLDDLPYASWDDVANLLSRAIKGGRAVGKDGKLKISSQKNVNAIASILKKLELETPDKKSREAINLLVTAIKKPPPVSEEDQFDKPPLLKKSFPDTPAISLEELQQFADAKKVNPKVLEKIPDSTTDTETLCIILQLADHEQPLQNQIRMQQFIRDSLSGKLNEKTWEILSKGLVTIASSGTQTKLTATLRMILDPLRRSEFGNTFQLFQAIIKICGNKEASLIWPHLVNELLVEGSGPDKIIYHQLCQYAARPSHDEMTANLSYLKGLECFQDYKIAPDIFHAVSPNCYPLFAFLFKTDIERYIGERVIGGLRRNPRDWLIKAIAPILDLTLQEHKLFLYSYLRSASQKVLSSALKKIATKIITETIPKLPQDRRSEQWLETTIASMAQLPSPQTKEMLKEIAGGKKLLFIPEWPTPCRKAAESALRSMKGN